MIARRLLFWSCIQQFRESYSAEMTVYDKLPDWRKEDEVQIDRFSWVHFGNIDIDNPTPLTPKLLEELEKSEHMKDHEFTNCNFWLAKHTIFET